VHDVRLAFGDFVDASVRLLDSPGLGNFPRALRGGSHHSKDLCSGQQRGPPMHLTNHSRTQNRYPLRCVSHAERLVLGTPMPPSTMQNGGVGGARILMVEDSDAIRLPVVTALTAQGFHVASVADGSDLEGLLPSFAPDLVILDIMLPGRDGFELLQVIRRTSTAAVLMLTAKDALADRVHALTEGADDYLIKPFAMAELVARIHAVLRRSRPGGSSISVDDLVINDEVTLVRRGEESLDLTETERRLLGYLAAHRDRVVSKTQILTSVWGYDGFDENVVEVHISSLRRKLEAGGRSRLVHTVRGRGYLLGTTA
jgi:DNA-binding response OmpR family regulator